MKLRNTALTVLFTTVTALMTSQSEGATVLGPAQNYNVFLFGNMSSQYSDIGGRVVVGGNAFFNGYSIGSNLGAVSGNSLVVGGNLSFTNGTVKGGNVVYGGSLTTNLSFSVADGSLYHRTPSINFSNAYNQLSAVSTSLVGSNSSYTYQGGALNFTDTSTTTTTPINNVKKYSVNATDFNSAHTINIDSASSDIVIINVSGSAINFSNRGIFLSGGIGKENVLYNFSEATDMNIASISVQGSILAPDASITFTSGNIEGTLVAQNVIGNGEFHNTCPLPTIIPEPLPAGLVSWAALVLFLNRRRRHTA